MTTATLEHPEIATLAEPTFAGLAVANLHLATGGAAAAGRKFYTGCSKFEDRVAKWHAAGRELYAQRLDRTLRESLLGLAKLDEELSALNVGLTELRYERVQLLPRFEPDFLANESQKVALEEQGILDECARLESIGAGLSSMRAWQVNPAAAEIQLRHLVLDAEPIRALTSARAIARSALVGLRAQIGNLPTPETCVVAWDPTVADFATKLRALG
jgi:hypothetical protein